MLFKSTFLQSSSIWKVMSALFITVRDALGQISQQYDKSKHTHIPYQLCSFIWILLKNIQTTIGTWHRWFNDVCRFRIWENLLDTEIQKEKKMKSIPEKLPYKIHTCLRSKQSRWHILCLRSNLIFLRFSGRSWSAILSHSSSCLANFRMTWVKLCRWGENETHLVPETKHVILFNNGHN